MSAQTQSPTPPTAEEVLATVGYTGFVRALFNRSGDPAKDFTHAILGILTECHELKSAKDDVNRIEEIGDLLFYAVALAQVVEDHEGPIVDKVDSYDTYSDEIARDQWSSVANDLLDHAKRWVGYGKKPENLHSVADLAVCLASSVAAAAMPEVDPEHTEGLVLLANVRKLLKRYHGMAFNAEHAVNRDLVAERRVLEQSAG